MKNLKLTTHFLIAIGLIFSSALVAQTSINFENKAIENQAGVFDSVKNIFSGNKTFESLEKEGFKQEAINLEQDYFLNNEFSGDEAVNDTIVFIRLSKEHAQFFSKYPLISNLPKDLLDVSKELDLVSVEQSFRPKDLDSKIARWITLEFPDPDKAYKFYSKAKELRSVEKIDRDHLINLDFTPQDEFYVEDDVDLWSLDLINAQDLWDVIENPGEGIVVSIIDTGVSNSGSADDEETHLDLLGSEWVNVNEIPNNDLDDDDNGYIDDYFGVPWLNNSEFYYDPSGHGTYVAGIIGAQSNNMGIPGIAFDSKIMPFKAGQSLFLGFYSTMEGVIYSVDNGASVINASFGMGEYSDLFADAFEYATSNDVIVIAAAGNNNGQDVCTRYPSGYEDVVSVSALTPYTWNSNVPVMAGYSNIGISVDLTAPAGDSWESGPTIVSTAYPNSPDQPQYIHSYGEVYRETVEGTSIAAPYVSAAAAIIRQLRPGWNIEEVRSGLRYITQPFNEEFFNEGFGFGLLDLSKIINLPEQVPVVQMYSPISCSQVSGVVNVEGSVYMEGQSVLENVSLQIAEGLEVGDSDFIEIDFFDSISVNNDFITSFNSAGFANGDHVLRLIYNIDGLFYEDRNNVVILNNICPYDLNSDGIVNSADLLMFLSDFTQFGDSPVDFNNNGIVDSNDLLEMLANFGQQCSEITGISPQPQTISTSNLEITNKDFEITTNLTQPANIEKTDLTYNYTIEIDNKTKDTIKDTEISNLIPETLKINKALSNNSTLNLNYKTGKIEAKKIRKEGRETTIYLDVELPEDICQETQSEVLEEYGLCK